MSIEAMEQALEALKANDELINGSRTHGGLVFAMEGYYAESFDIDGTNEKTEQAITALRQAIAEAEKQEPVAFHVHKSAIDENDFKEHVNFYKGPAPSEDFVTLYTTPVYASDIPQERVDETAKCKHEFECPRCGHCCQREWVWLTDEEIKEIVGPWGETPVKGYTRKLFDQIEAKLKEKNI
jgi:hypothetical protein